MGKKFVILEGKDYDELISKGLKELNKNLDEVKIEVLQEGKSVIGFTMKKHVIKISSLEDKGSSISLDNNLESHSENFFEIKFEEEGVYLSFTKERENSQQLMEDVLGYIVKKEINDYDLEFIKENIIKNDSGLIKIAPEQEERNIDETIEITLSHDKMKGYMTLMPALGGRSLSFEQVMEQICKVIKHGLNKENVKKALSERKYYKNILIAEGTEAINGKDGYIKFFFNCSKSYKPEILDDGKVDFRNLDLISNVNKDQILAEKIPQTEGSPGYYVNGDIINQIKGKEVVLKHGKNTYISDDNKYVFSATDGQVCLEDDKITVYETYEVSNNVDNSTGNINFNGNIKVRGSVLTGFEVKSEGNIEVEGVVEGALLQSGGDIILKRGIQGFNKGKLVSKGNVFAKYIENSNILSELDIHAEAIMHSEVISKGNIEVNGKKGLIVGGSCRATNEIHAKTIGSTMATTTNIEVGVDPSLKLNLETLLNKKKEIEENLSKIDQGLTLLTKLAKANSLTNDKQALLNKYIITRKTLFKQFEEINNKINDLQEKIEVLANGKIRVQDIVYPGVKVSIGNSTMFIRKELKHCTIYREDGDIKVGSY